MVIQHELAPRRKIILASVAMFLAGALHLGIIGQHWEHAPAHGIFFLLAGVSQIAWSILFWRSGSPALGRMGFVMALSLMLLWAVTRVVPAPFGHGPEEIDAAGLATKLCEGICAAALAAVLMSTFVAQPRRLVWTPIIGLVLISSALAGLAYLAAVAAEPYLPGLAPLEMEEHEHPHDEDHHENDHSMLPAMPI